MKPVKVFIVQKVLNFAGSEIYLQHLLPALRQQGVDAHFGLCCDDEQAPVTIRYKEQMMTNGVPVFVFKLNKRPSLQQLKAISKHLREQQYDLVHTHLLLADMSFALIKTFFNPSVKIVSTKHGYDEGYNNRYGFRFVRQPFHPYRLVAWLTEKKIKRSFAVSKALRDLYIGQGICPASSIDVIYHGFDYAEVLPNPALRFAEKQIVIVGRLTAFKGHRFAIQAMPSIVEKFPGAKLVVIGDGPLRQELERLSHELKISESVQFLGFHPNPREVVASSDVAAVPSVAEAFGLVILEAMSARTPIAAFNVPTPSEILIHKKTAMIAPPFDVGVFADNIIQLLCQPTLHQHIRQEAYQMQKNLFNLQTMVQNTISFYQRSLVDSH